MNILELRKVNKTFGNTKAVSDVSLTIKENEIVSIIGPSGSGKSTLLRLISNLEKIDSGEIILFDQSMSKLRDNLKKEVYQKIQFIFQDFALFSHLSVQDNLLLAPLRVYKQNKEAITKEMKALLSDFNLNDKILSYPESLSGGQRQRVAIARALLTHPKFILFDEPTSALDKESVEDLTQIILTLKQKGITILIVTHDTAFAKAVSERLIFMDNSCIIYNEHIDNISDQETRLHKYLG